MHTVVYNFITGFLKVKDFLSDILNGTYGPNVTAMLSLDAVMNLFLAYTL